MTFRLGISLTQLHFWPLETMAYLLQRGAAIKMENTLLLLLLQTGLEMVQMKVLAGTRLAATASQVVLLQGRNKYTAIEAREELRIMKQKGGLNKFSSTSEYGELPSIDQIKSFWSRYKSSTSSQVRAL